MLLCSNQKGDRDRLNKAGNDADMLGLAVTSIHGALEDACRNWLSAPGVKQQHGIDVSDKAKANWQNLLELMPRYCGWSDRDVRYVRKMNSLRNKAAHGDGFEGTRQDVEQYLSFVENAVANGGTFSDSSSETSTSSSSASQYFPNNIAQGGAVQPFRFRIERSDRGVKIFNYKAAQIISERLSNWELSEFIKITCLCLLILFLAHRFAPFIFNVLIGLPIKVAIIIIFLLILLCLWEIWQNVSCSVLITSDRIYIGKKSYSLPGITYFRFVPQNASNLEKMHFIRSDSVVYFAHNLSWHEADELLRIAVNANFMIEDSRSQFLVKIEDGLIFINSCKTQMSFVLEHNDRLWESLRCRTLKDNIVELTRSELEELHSMKLQEFRV